MRTSKTVIFLALLCLFSGQLPAQQASLALMAGQGVDHDLPGLPAAILGGDLRWQSSYFNALAFDQLWSPAPTKPWLSTGYELILSNHHGLQNVTELGAAARVTADTPAAAGWSARGGFGIGLSHVIGRPTFEDGPLDNPDQRYNTQLLLLFDAEVRQARYPGWAVFARVHHRSGVYGLIAPRRVGSNFIAAGIRRDF